MLWERIYCFYCVIVFIGMYVNYKANAKLFMLLVIRMVAG